MDNWWEFITFFAELIKSLDTIDPAILGQSCDIIVFSWLLYAKRYYCFCGCSNVLGVVKPAGQ